MANIEIYENSLGQQMVAINNGDSISYMLKSAYDEMIAQQTEQGSIND